MHEGKLRRLQRIFSSDKRTFIVAMDHAAYMPDVVLGLEHPQEIIGTVLEAGANAIMTTLGTVRSCQAALGCFPLIMSVESAPQYIEEVVEQAICYGVDMIKCMVYPFSQADPDSLLHFERLATVADRWSLPIMAEIFPGGFQAGPEWKTIDKLSAAARVTAEAGADVIKTFFIEEKGQCYQKVIENCPVPLVVLGGEKSDDPRPLLEKITRCLETGAAGVAIGRNIWGHSKPAAITAAVVGIIHQNCSVEKALKLLA
jgi:DhnA family fructose-bisphosphate aldolase class Ia